MSENSDKTVHPTEHLKPYQWKPGQTGNPGGRPKGTLKDYVREKFKAMNSEEKEAFLSKIPLDVQWKMGEGNPAQESDITSKGEKINIDSNPILEELANKLEQLDEMDKGTDKSSLRTPSESLDKKVSD